MAQSSTPNRAASGTKSESSLRFFSYDSFCVNAASTLSELGVLLGFEDLDTFVGQADRISAPRPYEVELGSIPSDVLESAEALYEELQDVSIR